MADLTDAENSILLGFPEVPRHLRADGYAATPEERADRYRVALITFGDHLSTCSIKTQRVSLFTYYFGRVPERSCTCGFDIVRNEAYRGR
jgi:hypothetical protein